MRILLDTNAFLWWFVGDERLSKRALAAMDEAEEVFYSMVSFWEVGLKMGRGGFDFPMPADWDVALLAEAGRFDMKETAIGAHNCMMISVLPPHHGDPFDRMLIAQALDKGLVVVSADGSFEKYGVVRVW